MRVLACPHSGNATLRALSESLNVGSVFEKVSLGMMRQALLRTSFEETLGDGQRGKDVGPAGIESKMREHL
jgi:hypothetical protein